MSLLKPIVTDSEIGDTERDAETEGPEFSSGSIQHDRKRRAQPPMLPCGSKEWG